MVRKRGTEVRRISLVLRERWMLGKRFFSRLVGM